MAKKLGLVGKFEGIVLKVNKKTVKAKLYDCAKMERGKCCGTYLLPRKFFPEEVFGEFKSEDFYLQEGVEFNYKIGDSEVRYFRRMDPQVAASYRRGYID